MSNFQELKIINCQADEIYQLVMDIEKYPEFLPWCKQAKIVEVISSQNLQADLLIAFKNFFEKYRSDVTHNKDDLGIYFIEAKAIAGPFKKMFSRWKITPLEHKKCQVEFFIDFEFSSIILEKIFGAIFEKAAQKMMECFVKRANELHSHT